MMNRLRKVEHIEVFDMEGEMVAGKKEDPFSYTHQKEYYLGNKKMIETNYDSCSRRINISTNQLKTLKRRVNKMLEHAFCFVDDESTVEVVVRGGSTINYKGNHKDEFLEKILDIKKMK